jgi:hypothetical protein
MIASSISVALSGGQIFEPAPQIDAALANRSRRFAVRCFDPAVIISSFGFAFHLQKWVCRIDYRNDIL